MSFGPCLILDSKVLFVSLEEYRRTTFREVAKSTGMVVVKMAYFHTKDLVNYESLTIESIEQGVDAVGGKYRLDLEELAKEPGEEHFVLD